LRIRNDASFLPIWKALRRFVAKEDCTLVVVLGNHDIELALPAVQEVLLDSLCSGSEAARGRIRMHTVGVLPVSMRSPAAGVTDGPAAEALLRRSEVLCRSSPPST
jgi:hypothetical protein